MTKCQITINPENVFFLQIVECLLNNNCDPDTADWMGSTPMHRAASKGHIKVVALLLQFQAQIDCADKEGNTPL